MLLYLAVRQFEVRVNIATAIDVGHVCGFMRIHHLITIALFAHVTAKQLPFNTFEPVLTPGLTDIIQGIVDKHQVPGLALAVVRKNGYSEFGTWGKRSEDGARVTEDVC